SRRYGRCAVDRRRSREGTIRADDIATLVPSAHPSGSRIPDDPAALKAALIDAAHAQGFDVVGVTRPDAIPQAQERLKRFLADGAHGDMGWMATTADRRGDPRALWREARSVVML